MEKYSNKIINDYINGNDIEEYSIEELEDDKKFMMLVINRTNDIRMYDLCSDNVKKDYEFVKYMILKYQNNTDFSCKVADYYFDNKDDEFSRTELAILMSEITKNKDKNKYIKYQIILEANYKLMRVQIEMAKMETNDRYVADEIGMGFLLIFDCYNSSNRSINSYFNSYIN